MNTSTAPLSSSVPTSAPAPAEPDAAARLRLTITRLHRLLRQHSTGELTLTQTSALAAVRHLGPITLGALAATEQVSPPTITNVVGKLEARHMVERTIDPTDRRVCRVSITPTGDAFLAEVRQQRTAWLVDRLDQLGPDERRRLTDALDVLEQLAGDPLHPEAPLP